MFAHIRATLILIGLFTLTLGVGYPLLITAITQAAFPAQADGSLIRDGGGRVVGSALISQPFTGAAYLHPRPSAAGAEGHDATASSGSNLGPTNPALLDRVEAASRTLRHEAADTPIPSDAVTTSGSGLDPHISPGNALRQATRIAAARGAPVEEVRRLIQSQIAQPALGFIGQPRVNVLSTNLALDAAFPRRDSSAP